MKYLPLKNMTGTNANAPQDQVWTALCAANTVFNLHLTVFALQTINK